MKHAVTEEWRGVGIITMGDPHPGDLRLLSATLSTTCHKGVVFFYCLPTESIASLALEACAFIYSFTDPKGHLWHSRYVKSFMLGAGDRVIDINSASAILELIG